MYMKIKTNNWIGLTGFLILILSSFNSCVKDRNYSATNFSQAGNVVDLPVSGLKTLAFDVTPTPQVVQIYVELGGPIPAKDVEVTLAYDQEGLDAYNIANSTELEKLPDSAFTITSLKTTIKRGDRLAFVEMTIVPNKVDLSGQYAIALKIADAQGITIAGNLGSVIYSVGVKNSYDGQYALKIKTVGWAAYGIADGVTYTYPSTIGLITSGASSVTLSTTSQPAFTNAGAVTGFGATQPQLIFDPVSNKLTNVVNLVPDDGRGRAFSMNPAVTDSRYDPDAKIIYAAYTMHQNGRPNQFIYDTLTYKGPRP